MKRVKQIKENKKIIYETFLRMLEVQDFDTITFSEIAYEANISRMTVYRHFKTKEAIILFGFEQMMDNVIVKMSSVENVNLQNLLLHWFSELYENPHTMTLLKHNGLKAFSQTINLKYCDVFRKIMPPLNDEYYRSFFLGGLDSIIGHWLENNMQESPDEITMKVLFLGKKMHEMDMSL